MTCACGQQMRAPASALGKKGRCTLCGREFIASSENSVAAPPLQPAPTPKPASAAMPRTTERIASLDQLRGYAIFGMILVNYLGNFAFMPRFFEHQRDTFSYADTIAPLFLFVVGMGFRLSLMRRIQKVGVAEARFAALKRYLILFVVGAVFYGPDYEKDWWDAFTQIALAGVLALPFIDKKTPIRIGAACLYLALYMLLFHYTGYGEWLRLHSMNGGPLGVLPAAFTLIFGTLAYDLLASDETEKAVTWSAVWGVGLVAAAFAVWWFMPKEHGAYLTEYGQGWPWAKRWSSAPFALLSTGLAFLVFLAFFWVCDVLDLRVPHLSVLGENPLVIYLLQYSLLEMNGTFLPDSVVESTSVTSVILGFIGFALFYGFCYAAAWRLHQDKTIIKL